MTRCSRNSFGLVKPPSTVKTSFLSSTLPLKQAFLLDRQASDSRRTFRVSDFRSFQLSGSLTLNDRLRLRYLSSEILIRGTALIKGFVEIRWSQRNCTARGELLGDR